MNHNVTLTKNDNEDYSVFCKECQQVVSVYNGMWVNEVGFEAATQNAEKAHNEFITFYEAVESTPNEFAPEEDGGCCEYCFTEFDNLCCYCMCCSTCCDCTQEQKARS